MVMLAAESDVVNAIGRDLTPSESLRVNSILGKASELFRRHSGQNFTPGESLVRLKVNGGKVYLPERPVIEVMYVQRDDGSSVEFDLFGQWLTVPLRSSDFVRVSYTHGGVVPDAVRFAVADLARKVLQIDPAAVSGMTQNSTTTGPYNDSVTYASWAQGGQTMLSPDDMALAGSFRVKVPTVWVTS